MRAALPVFCLTLLSAALPALPARSGTEEQASLSPDAPVERFNIHAFDPLSGWRTWRLEGERAEFPSPGAVRMRDITFIVFEPEKAQRVMLRIESPVAETASGREQVTGPGEILVTADGFLLAGRDWTWHTGERRLSIRSSAHAVIEGELCPILE